jgi:hypothetical protein
MGHSAEKRHAETWIASTWPHDVLSSFDVVGVLSASLTPGWYVERTVDPSGDIAIIVLPADDDPEQPSFVLYEKDGLVEVGTIAGETWRGSRQLPSCQRAVAAIVAASALVFSP